MYHVFICLLNELYTGRFVRAIWIETTFRNNVMYNRVASDHVESQRHYMLQMHLLST